jgi:hypothetical protein
MISEKIPQEIILLSKPGIWALVNEVDRKVFLSFSGSMADSLTRNMMALKDGSHRYKPMVEDVSKLTLKVLEEFSGSNVENRLRLNYWIDHFKQQKYRLYNKDVSIKLCIRKDLVAKPVGVLVSLINRRYKRIPLGIFKNMTEADRFIETHYSNGIYNIIKASNQMSLDYFRKHDENNLLD